MKKKITGIAAVMVAVVLAVYAGTIWKARKTMTEAVEACNDAIREYNEKIIPYNEAALQTAAANEKLEGLLASAKTQVESGKKAYEEDTLDQLKRKVTKASKAFVEAPEQIEAYEAVDIVNAFDHKALEAAAQKAREREAAVREAVEKIPEPVSVPDYGKEESSVEKAMRAYLDSVQKLANVTAPEDSFVAKRLGSIDTVTGTAAVTKENDPNRLLGTKGGYRGCVYFRDNRIDLKDLSEETPSLETIALLEELWPLESKEEESDGQSAEGEPEAEEKKGDGQSAEGEPEPEEEKAEEETAGAGDTAAAGESTATETDLASAGESAERAADTASAGESAERAADTASSGETRATGTDLASTAGTAAAALPEEENAGKDREKKEKLAIIREGAAGGGAVEVYATEEEARARDQYLAFYEGSIMDPGGHTVEGTCVIRVSRHLEEAEQQELMKKIREALLKVE